MIERFKSAAVLFREKVFKRYPVTMGGVFAATFLCAVIVEFRADTQTARALLEFFQKLAMFSWTFAAGALFCEQVLRANNKIRVAGYAVSAVAAAAFVLILSEMPDGRLAEETGRVYVCYLTWITALSAYSMYRSCGRRFCEYCMRAFGGVMKTTLVYGLFALGVALIILIYNELIFDTDDFLTRLEILLAGWIYVPGVILSVSDTERETGRFYNLIVKYVLMPLVLLAFLIIYLYIVKIVVTTSFPSNRVFGIVSWLFAIGLPVWTFGCVFRESDIMGKIAAILPFVFVPFIVLQILCIGLRIGQYGLTNERYFACALIFFEIVYVALFAIGRERFLSLILFAAASMITVTVLVPGIRADDAVYYTQAVKLKAFLEMSDEEREELIPQQKKRMLGSYNAIRWDDRGKAYMESLSKKDRDWIEEVGEEMDAYIAKIREYHNAYNQIAVMDIEGYAKMYRVSGYGPHNINIDEDMLHAYTFRVSSYDADSEKAEFVLDIYEYVKEFEACPTGYQESNDWLKSHPRIFFADGSALEVESIHITKTDGDYDGVQIDGYYLK